jgi:hypothetical protein
MGVEHNIIVEPQEVKLYQNAINKLKLLTTVVPLDMSMKTKYELCDDLGLTKSTGSGPARNWAWEHSIKQGHTHHWVMDDNIRHFRRINNNRKVIIESGAGFRAMEDFSKRYLNVAMSGPQYSFFSPRKEKFKPIILNTRVFSCNFIRNSAPFRWRGRYNEDIILSLDMLKAGWCTLLFRAFTQDKMVTQTMKGGNTTELYDGTSKNKDEKFSKTGTIAKSVMLQKVHPDFAEVVWKYDRIHHSAKLRSFQKTNRLIPDPNWKAPKDKEYGLILSQA